MKRWICTTLAILMILLIGCTKTDKSLEKALSVRQKLQDADGCSFHCTIHADYQTYVYSFSLSCQFDGDGVLTFSVIEPETIQGITGTVDREGGRLTFDNKVLAFPALADGYISPVIAPWLLIKTIRGGYISYCDLQDDGILIGYDDSFLQHPLQTQLWTDQDGIPARCDLIWKNQRILSLEVSNYTYL